MDESLDGLDCRLRVSGMVADSIMMGIVNSAMEKAFEKACSKEGDFERLNEKSRFCELAVMQLEWCLKFVLEETDNYVVVESIHEREKLVSDLTETKDRIQRRLEETEFAVSEKDRELTERLGNELKLRQGLELRDRELRTLRTYLKLERTKSDGVQEFIHGNRVGGDDDRDDNFCELKNSVDQQFFYIKQKLEDERINLTNGIRKMSQGISNTFSFESDSQLVDKEGNCSGEEIEFYEEDCDIKPPNCSLRPELNTGFEKMGSDIDILKETLDLAFGMMSNAISLSEVGPMEQQWRWTIEKDTLAVVFRGFLRDVHESPKEKVGKGRKQGPLVLLGENWSELMNEITILRDELNLLISENEDRPKTVTGRDSVTPPSVTDECKGIPQKVNWLSGKPSPKSYHGSSMVDRNGKPENSSSKIKELDHLVETPKEDPSGQASLVAEMIRNHESIIRKKSEELNWLKGEILRERGCSSVKKDKDNDSLKKKIQDVLLRLDSFIEGNAKINAPCDDCRCVHENDVVIADLSEEARQLNLERGESNLKGVIKEEINVILFKSLARELYLESYNCDTESLIREEVWKAFFKEMVNGWNEDLESYNIESQIREEIYQIVFVEVVKDAHVDPTSTECRVESNENDFLEDSPSSNKFIQNLEVLIGDDMRKIYLQEMVKEWNDGIESYDIKSCIREEVHHIVFCGAVKEMDRNKIFTPREHQKAKRDENSLDDSSSSDNFFQILECLIRDDVHTIVLREMVMESSKVLENCWIENLFREEIYWIVFNEVIKNIEVAVKITSTECQEAKNQDYFLEELSSNNMVQNLESQIREGDCKVFCREIVKECKEMESNSIDSIIREEIDQIVIGEAIKDFNSYLMEFQEVRNQEHFLKDLPTGNNLFQGLRFSEKENLIQNSKSLSQHYEMGERLTLGASSELMEQNGHTDLVDLGHGKPHEISCEGISIQRNIGPVRNKLEKAPRQIVLSKVHLKELGSNLGIEAGDLDVVHDQMTPSEATVQDRENSLCSMARNEEVQIDQSGYVFTPFSGITKVYVDFECMVHERIGLNISRLEGMKQQLDLTVEHAALLRKKELLYRKAFLRRCYDLQKAEAEVDLLADEVDALLGLLKKIYLVLDPYTPVLQNYFGIMDILKLIRKELNGKAACTPY